MPEPRVTVVGGGLAGITAALDAAAAGCKVLLLERRKALGGLTRSFTHAGFEIDNGQHVFLRCCERYLSFLQRIGARQEVSIQPRLAVRMGAPGAPSRWASLERVDAPVPLHIARSLATFGLVGRRDRARAGLAAAGLSRLRLDDPALDQETFAAFLARHAQSASAIDRLWNPICLATVNLSARRASLAMAAKVFQTGLLRERDAADIGWSSVPLGRLHGEYGAQALNEAGVRVIAEAKVEHLSPTAGGWTLSFTGAEHAGAPTGIDTAGSAPRMRRAATNVVCDGVVVAVSHEAAADLLPSGAVARQDQLAALGTSPIVNVHLVFDRRVTDLPFFASVGTTAQWIFDRTASSGVGQRFGSGVQYLAVTISGAEAEMGLHPEQIRSTVVSELRALLPGAVDAQLLESLVTKERHATFAAIPGTASLRPGPATAYRGLAVAGAWTDTGWPATMEGAVISGHAAARALLSDLRSVPLTPKEAA